MEDKKSFILYADLMHTLEKLPDAECGQLFKHILRYVNDRNPETDSILVEIAFEPIKQQLKRDLSKWEDKSKGRKESGIKGNLKRWHPDLYDLVESGKMTIEDAVIIANDRKASLPDEKASHPIANIADNGTVSVTDNVTVNENVIEIETPTPFQGDISLKKNDDAFTEPKKSRSKKTPGPKFTPDLSEYDENTQGLILQWIEHRAALEKHIKTQYAISRFVAELRRLADGSFNKAKELVEYMRYREWQTVCPIPQNYQKNGKAKQSNEDHARTVVNIAANAIAGAEKSKLEREERERRQRESGQKY